MIAFKGFFLVLTMLMLQSVAETKELMCEISNDNRKKLCYLSSNQGCAEFHSCQQTICIVDGNGGCKQTTFELSEKQCFIQVCNFNPYEGNLQQCISQFRKTENDFTSTIESVVITGLIIFIMVSIILEIKNCLCPGTPDQQESDQNSEDDQLQLQRDGFIEVNSSQNIVQMSQIQKQKKRREMFMKRHKLDEPQFDLNLGFINQRSPLKEPIEIQNQVCCICLTSENINTQTACGHFYHSKCLLGWLKMKQFCPSCRRTNFSPVKLFCTNCKKVRDIFRIKKKSYMGYSRISGEYFNRFDSCNSCIDRMYEPRSQPIINQRQLNK